MQVNTECIKNFKGPAENKTAIMWWSLTIKTQCLLVGKHKQSGPSWTLSTILWLCTAFFYHFTVLTLPFPRVCVYCSLFFSVLFSWGGDPALQVCHLLHSTAQALHSGWTVCRTPHAMLLLFSSHPPAAFKWPLAVEAHLIYRLEGRKQVGLGLDLFQGYDYKGNLEEERGLIGIMSFGASVHQMDI